MTTAAPAVAMPRSRHDLQDWWVPVFRGLILSFCGLFLFIPSLTFAGAVFVFSSMAIMSGGLLLHNARELRSVLPMVQGFVAFTLGAVAMLLTDMHRAGILVCAGLWGIVVGAGDIFLASRHKRLRGRYMFILAGVIGMLGGVLMLVEIAVPSLPWVSTLATVALLYGAELIVAGVRRLRRHGHAAAHSASRRDELSERGSRNEWADFRSEPQAR
jgi:uncharacterized membrane protein HdeD (DUF308 family)